MFATLGYVKRRVPVRIEYDSVRANVPATLSGAVPFARAAVRLARIRRRNRFNAFSNALCLVRQYVHEPAYRGLPNAAVVGLPLVTVLEFRGFLLDTLEILENDDVGVR